MPRRSPAIVYARGVADRLPSSSTYGIFVCSWTRSASDTYVGPTVPKSSTMSGRAARTTSTFAVLPRPVRRPNAGRSAYFAGSHARSSAASSRVQPGSGSGASVYTKTLAGPPAAKTRRIVAGTSTRRPALSTMTRLWARAARGATSAAIAAPRSQRRVSTSVLGYDDVRGLDDRIGGVALFQTELVDRFVRDRGRHHRPATHVDLHVGGRRPTRHLDYSPLDDVARAELH